MRASIKRERRRKSGVFRPRRVRQRALPPRDRGFVPFHASRNCAVGSGLRPVLVRQDYLFLEKGKSFEEVHQLSSAVRRAFRVAAHDGSNDGAMEACAFVESVGLLCKMQASYGLDCMRPPGRRSKTPCRHPRRAPQGARARDARPSPRPCRRRGLTSYRCAGSTSRP
jgi:hypothetical protein